MSLKEKLSKMEYHVTQEAGTEPPFSGKYHDEKSEGKNIEDLKKFVWCASACIKTK